MFPGKLHDSTFCTIPAESGCTAAPSALRLNGDVLAYGRQFAAGRLPPPNPSQPVPVPGAEVGSSSVVGSGAEPVGGDSGAGSGEGVVVMGDSVTGGVEPVEPDPPDELVEPVEPDPPDELIEPVEPDPPVELVEPNPPDVPVLVDPPDLVFMFSCRTRDSAPFEQC